MKTRKWGRIVNIASAHGLVASERKVAYVAAKHGIVGMTKVVAHRGRQRRRHLNAICPGWVLTPLVQKQIDAQAAEKKIPVDKAKHDLLAEKQPMLEFTTPEHLGKLVLFLVSDGGRHHDRRGALHGRRLGGAVMAVRAAKAAKIGKAGAGKQPANSNKKPASKSPAARPVVRRGGGAPAAPATKTINLALQGGGSHGAFTWGVLDRLLEEERLVIEGISGTSAGAMNARGAGSGLLPRRARGRAPARSPSSGIASAGWRCSRRRNARCSTAPPATGTSTVRRSPTLPTSSSTRSRPTRPIRWASIRCTICCKRAAGAGRHPGAEAVSSVRRRHQCRDRQGRACSTITR